MKSVSKLFLLVSCFALTFMSQSSYAQEKLDIAKSKLIDTKGDFKIKSENMSLVSSHTSIQSGLTHFYFNQTLNDVKIYNAISNVAVGKDDQVYFVGDRFVQFKSADSVSPQINSQRSLESVAQHFDLTITSQTTKLSEKNTVGRESVLRNESISERDINTSLMYVNVDGHLHLCWSVAIEKIDDRFWWDVKVNAADGSILEKTSWTVECNFDHPDDACDHSDHSHNILSHNHKSNKKSNHTSTTAFIAGDYMVSAIPDESPIHGPLSIVNSPWMNNIDANAHPLDWHDDGTMEYFTTRGNNVWAVEDRDGNNNSAAAFSPPSQLGTSITFGIPPAQQYNFTPDFNLSPVDYQSAAITNLFYWNNITHDIMYHYGFDEASGNFQAVNVTGLGVGGDFILAEAQDGSMNNNAIFSTAVEGSSPRLTMFEWNQTAGTTFEVTSPFTANYFSLAATFGPNATFSGQVVEADDTTGGSHESCTANPISNAGALAGNIALIDRGICSFVEKVSNAEAAGAIAVVVCNNVPGIPFAMGGTGPFPGIPSVMISQADCATLRANLPANINVVTSTGPPVNRDSDYDNGVIVHEYGHGISTRLTGGSANIGCLGNQEQMGEGWSDYFGLILTIKPGDNGPQTRGIGTYLLGQPTIGPGIRPFPYSTDFTINPMTYGFTDDGGNITVPHGIGAIWCTAIWEMTWELINIYGIGTDIYDSDIANAGTVASPGTFGGQNLALQLVMEGLKLQPCSPGFIDGRDAILAADQALYGGIHQCALWDAFARRGLGFSASQGSSNVLADNVEAFDLPPREPPFSKTAVSAFGTDGSSISFDLIVQGFNCDPITNISITDTVDPSLTITSVVCSSGTSSVTGNVVTFSGQGILPNQSVTCTVIATTNVSANPALTVGIINDDVESGNIMWEINNITNSSTGQWTLNNTEVVSGTNSWFAINTDGPDKTTALESIELPLGVNPSLSFSHHYDTEANWDGGFVQVSTNGGSTWTDLPNSAYTQNGYNGVLGASSNNFIANKDAWTGNSNGFVQTVADLSAFSNGLVQIRFVYGQDNNTFERGWWIDDISIDLDNSNFTVVPNVACYESDQDAQVCDGAIVLVSAGCVSEYTAANGNMLTGAQTTSQHYETDGAIESDQQVSGSISVDYDSGTLILLKQDFSVQVGTIFHAYIDGCNGIASPLNAPIKQ